MDKKHLRILKVSAALLVCIVVGFMLFKTAFPEPNYKISNLSEKKSENTYMEIANTTASRIRGLMFREKIISILFIFDSDDIYPIHSNFVIDKFDAVYLSSNKTVLEIFRKIPPSTQRVTPTKKARYLLELPVDMTDRLNISVGDRLSWKEIEKK